MSTSGAPGRALAPAPWKEIGACSFADSPGAAASRDGCAPTSSSSRRRYRLAPRRCATGAVDAPVHAVTAAALPDAVPRSSTLSDRPGLPRGPQDRLGGATWGWDGARHAPRFNVGTLSRKPHRYALKRSRMRVVPPISPCCRT